jgi:tRNA(fMet)-specific endonuclease VapC
VSYLLDTNIVTGIIKKNPRINVKLEEVRFEGAELLISCITYYEVKRGLLYLNATRQLSDFNRLCSSKIKVTFLDEIQIIEKASEIHADLKRRGRPIQDADILIAATAIIRGLILVSNDSDMLRVSELALENWLQDDFE